MKELASLPSSILQRIDAAQSLPLSQQVSAMAEAMSALAQTCPDLFALLCASQMGCRQLVQHETDTVTEEFSDPRHFLGIRTGDIVRTKTTTRTKTKTHRFS